MNTISLNIDSCNCNSIRNKKLVTIIIVDNILSCSDDNYRIQDHIKQTLIFHENDDKLIDLFHNPKQNRLSVFGCRFVARCCGLLCQVRF